MISGMVAHTGSPGLATHLLRTDHNESVDVRVHGLCATNLHSALSELRGMAVDARTAKPLLHAWSSPAVEYDPDQWQAHWDRFETEFDLIGQPYVEVGHLKFSHGGRTTRHVHRVYLRIAPEGKVIPIRWSAARLEKLSRISEFLTGEPLTSGTFNRSVIHHLHKEGYAPVADAMVDAGLDSQRSNSVCSPSERAAAERSGDVAPDDWKRRIFLVLTTGKSGGDLVAAFADVGIRLATGDKAIVAVTSSGNRIPVLRSYNQISRSRGGETMKKAELDHRLLDIDLPLASDLKPEPVPSETAPVPVGATRREARLAGEPTARPDRPRQEIVHDQPVRVLAPIDLGTMTPEQSQVLHQWSDLMFAPPPELERQPEEKETPKPEDAERLAGEKRHLRQPSLEHPAWRHAYKAKLAGVPLELGPRLAWVDRRERDRIRITLKSGAVITSEPGRVSTTEATLDTSEVMVQRVLAMGMTRVVVHGGTAAWREAIAREATRSGICIVSPDLADIVADETQRIETRNFCAAWKVAHRGLQRNTPETAAAFMDALLALSQQPHLPDVLPPEDMRLFEQHLSRVRAFRETHGGGVSSKAGNVEFDIAPVS